MGHVHVHKSSAQRGPRSLSKTRGRWAGSLSTLNITVLLESALGLPSGLHGDEGRPVAMRGPLVVARLPARRRGSRHRASLMGPKSLGSRYC